MGSNCLWKVSSGRVDYDSHLLKLFRAMAAKAVNLVGAYPLGIKATSLSLWVAETDPRSPFIVRLNEDHTGCLKSFLNLRHCFGSSSYLADRCFDPAKSGDTYACSLSKLTLPQSNESACSPNLTG